MHSQHHAREDEVEKDTDQAKKVDPLIESIIEISEISEIDGIIEVVREDMTDMNVELNIDHIEIKDRISTQEEEVDTNVVLKTQSSYNLGLMTVLKSKRKSQMMQQMIIMRGRERK